MKSDLQKLTLKELREFGKKIGCPIRTSSRKKEVVSEIEQHLSFDKIWKGIAGR